MKTIIDVQSEKKHLYQDIEKAFLREDYLCIQNILTTNDFATYKKAVIQSGLSLMQAKRLINNGIALCK